jgi:hypothetical protein
VLRSGTLFEAASMPPSDGDKSWGASALVAASATSPEAALAGWTRV